ncbi:hypothetical protein GEMRC1_001767 [Eukaryota sp. GEM-RC1]
MGPFSIDSSGYKYVIVFIDAFSRFTVLKPVTSITANDCAYALIESVISHYGIPSKIHSDNGSEFANKIFKDLCTILNISTSFSIPYAHESNGLVERRNREVNKHLKRFLYDTNSHEHWSSQIPMVQILLNSQKSSVTQFTPYQLIFGAEVDPRSHPISLLTSLDARKMHPSMITPTLDSLAKFSAFLLERWEKAASNQLSYVSKLKQSKAAHRSQPFKVGDLVLRLTENPKRLHGPWRGPFEILEASDKSSTVKILNIISGIPTKCSTRLLRHFHSVSSDPTYLKAIAALDNQESIIDTIVDVDGDDVIVKWADGSTTVEPLNVIRKTEAFKSYRKA